MAVVRLSDLDHEDIRLAVVMNGGVSLAVWMGGVTLEINRLSHASPADDDTDVYGGLLDLVQGKARVDVISGTSAGGINGAFLALAEVYGQDLAPLGRLWADKGAMGDLLRSPLQKSPPSLMRGDDYFLPSLAEAFADVFPNDPERSYRPPHVAPVDLTITTSILKGEPRVFYDDFGTPIAEVEHRGEFRFRRDAATLKQHDPFRHPQLTAQLALASRSTASFPFAFEASWCPVHGGDDPAPDGAGIDDKHPNMHRIADFTTSKYLVDGGVLLNKPMAPALQSIRGQRAGHQVRRILCYINPDPGNDAVGTSSDAPGKTPQLTRTVVDSLFTLPMAQSIDAALEDLQQRNERARDRKESRLELVAGLGAGADDLADHLYGAYRVVRRRRAIGAIADIVMQAQSHAWDVQQAVAMDRPAWTRADVVAAFNTVPELPFVPPKDLEVALAAGSRWQWGLAVAERLGFLAVDVLRRAMWLVPMGTGQTPHPVRESLVELRRQLHAQLESLRDLRTKDHAFWWEQGRSMTAPPDMAADRPETLKRWADQCCDEWSQQADVAAVRAHAVGLADILVRTRAACDALPGQERRAWAREDRRLLDALLGVLVPAGPAEDCLPRLLRTEIVTLATGVSREEVEQVVDLIQISGNGPNSFGAPETAVKLAGVKLAHFAAFYKESWRVNDWIWGRIDGASRLVRAVLDPARLRQLGYTPQGALDAIKALATGKEGEAHHDALAALFEEDRCADELTFLKDDTRPLPPGLPACAMAVARRLHLQILSAELPLLAEAVDRDVATGAAPQSNGTRFRDAYRHAASRPGGVAPDETFELFRRAKVGDETIQDDVGSGLFAETVSTAAAVTTATLAGDDGPKALQAVGRTLRGIAMLLFAMVRGTAMGGTPAALVTVALGVGGACLAVFLLTRATPPVVPFVGFIVLLAGLAHASLRNRLKRQGWYLVAGVVITIAAGVLLVWLLPMVATAWQPLVRNVLLLVGVIALVLGMMALGGIDEVRRDPDTGGADGGAGTAAPSGAAGTQ